MKLAETSGPKMTHKLKNYKREQRAAMFVKLQKY
jgi:hypothetical protein